MARIDTPEAAMRLARAIAGDIRLYNQEQITEGIKADDLFDRIKGELDEGHSLYRSRVAPELFETTNFFYRAVIDMIVKPMGHVQSKIW